MNKQFFACILFSGLLLLNFTSRAQKTWLGIKGGMSIPNLQGGNNEVSRGYNSKLAPNFGIFGDLGINDKFSIQAEINFAGQGGIRDGLQPITQTITGFSLPPGTYLYADFKNESILNYLEFPVMLKYTWGSKWKYYAVGGPYIGFLLSAKQKTSGTGIIYVDKDGTIPLTIGGQPLPPVDFTHTEDVKDQLNSVNIGITGGLGIARYMGNNYLFLDLRGAYGFTHVQKDTELNGSSHTGCLVLTLGFAVRLNS